jgi:hypothetical protein
VPSGELSSTGYCLAEPGQEYLVYAPAGIVPMQSVDVRTTRPVTVNLSGTTGQFTVEWMDIETGTMLKDGSLDGGGERMLTVPFSGGALAHLRLSKQPIHGQR